MRKIIMIGVLFIASSCVTSKVTSNKSASFNEKIDKLFIMVKGTDSAKTFFNSFTSELTTSLREKGIESNNHYFEPLSLESESDVDIKIQNYNPNLIMIINQTESRQMVNANGFGWGYGASNTGGTFDVKIFQPNAKNPVWRANLKADGQFGLETSAKKACEKLIEKLIEDKLL